MKRIQMILLALFFAFSAMAQSPADNIKRRFEEQATAIKNKNVEKALDYTVEEIYNLVPREQMQSSMQETFNNPLLEIVSSVPDIISIGEQEKIGEKHYVILEAKGLQKIRMFDENQKIYNSGDSIITQLTRNLGQLYGAANVKFSDDTGFIEVVIQQKYIAISTDGKSDWKFLAIDKTLYPMLDQLFPEEIVYKLKS